MEETGNTGVENTPSYLGLLIYEMGSKTRAQVARPRWGLSGNGAWRDRHLAGNRGLIIFHVLLLGILWRQAHVVSTIMAAQSCQTTLKGPPSPTHQSLAFSLLPIMESF